MKRPNIFKSKKRKLAEKLLKDFEEGRFLRPDVDCDNKALFQKDLGGKDKKWQS